MALFDSLMNLTPDQNQGLLAAAAALLQAGGPSRTPTSFGQALGGGLQAFQQGLTEAEQRRLQREQQAQNARLLGLKIQDAESDVANQAAARQRAADLQAFYRSRGAGGNLASAVPAGQTANLSPTVENAAALTAGLPTGAGGTPNLFQQRIAEAQALRSAGFGAEADIAENAALKLQPKVKGWEKVQQGGRVLYAPFFEDGTSGAPVPLDVAEKLEQVNLGGTQQLVNPFTGQVVTSAARTASPDALLSAATSRRGQDLTFQSAGLDRAQRVQAAPKLTEDQAKATGWLVQASQAYENLRKAAFTPSGQISAAARPGFADALSSIPLVGEASANTFRSGARQRFNQAASSLSESLLRAATGAGVNRDEAAQKVRELTPQFGEDEATIQQKFDSIPAYIETLRVRAGPGGAQAPGILQRTRPASSPGGWSIQRVGE